MIMSNHINTNNSNNRLYYSHSSCQKSSSSSIIVLYHNLTTRFISSIFWIIVIITTIFPFTIDALYIVSIGSYTHNTPSLYYPRISSLVTASASTSSTVLAMNMNSNNHELIPNLNQLQSFSTSYASAYGIQVETKPTTSPPTTTTTTTTMFKCAPISLLPNIFPSCSFLKAQTLSPYFNILVDRISRNPLFLNDTLQEVVSKDEYTAQLLKLYNSIYCDNNNDDEGGSRGKFAKDADRLGIQRSDYMLNRKHISTTNDENVVGGGCGGDGASTLEQEYELKQVELNTIASSFAGLAVQVSKLHKLTTLRFGDDIKNFIIQNQKSVMGEHYNIHQNNLSASEEETCTTIGVPDNPALSRLPQAMYVAHQQYMNRFCKDSSSSSKSKSPVILFVVQEGETNTVDQRMLEIELYKTYQIPVIRMSLTRAHTHLSLDETNGILSILPNDDDDPSSHPMEVSVVYFRAGYAPTDYPDGIDGIEWKSREKIERSRATKCPNLGYHLAGTKKVQQQLARPGVLEQFFDLQNAKEGCMVEELRSAFAGLYSLGSDAMDEDLDAVKRVLSGEEGQYVLKPQREGGGYNYYNDRLLSKLKENITIKEDGEERMELNKNLAEFILMQRLFPPQQMAILLRDGKVEGCGPTISELGCFGTILANKDGEILHNEYGGFLLRTKFSGVDEGGVASGFATLSSPYLS